MERFIVMHDIDMADFMKTLDQCKGDVFLETKEGDVLIKALPDDGHCKHHEGRDHSGSYLALH